MTGFNLPPGVESHMLPGNSREDEIAELICDDCRYLIDDECPCDYDFDECPNDILQKIEDEISGNIDDTYDRMREREFNMEECE